MKIKSMRKGEYKDKQKKKRSIKKRSATICQIARIVERMMEMGSKFSLGKHENGEEIYNPLADPRSSYYMGVFLCSHALATLEPCLQNICKDSPAYVAAPPQGF
jgi:hypothetical protein